MLERARGEGFLGPGDVRTHRAHAVAMASVVDPPRRFLDLGAGGGVPGLILLRAWPGSRGVLLEARRRPTAFLRRALADLELDDRAEVLEGRAEVLARSPSWRGQFDLVVARGFGPPAVTAECAVGFLAPGSVLVVAEPPDPDARRWPEDELAELGLRLDARVRRDGFGFALLRRLGPADPRWPRRVPAKRPLWEASGARASERGTGSDRGSPS